MLSRLWRSPALINKRHPDWRQCRWWLECATNAISPACHRNLRWLGMRL